MNIPLTIQIGATTWEIIEKTQEEMDDNDGLCDPSLHKIELSKATSPKAREITLVHELLHAITSLAEFDDEKKYTEEEFVQRVAPWLHLLLEQNHEKLFPHI